VRKEWGFGEYRSKNTQLVQKMEQTAGCMPVFSLIRGLGRIFVFVQ
jgi:hypothetical protein